MEREWGEAFAQAKAFLSEARQPEVKHPEVSKFECLNVFSLIETICRKCGQKFRPRMQKFHFQLTCIAQKRPCLLWLKTIVNAIMIIISYFLATERFFNISFLQMSLPHSHGILLFWLCLETRRAGKTDASVARRKDEAFGGCTFQVKTAFFYFVQFPYFQWPRYCTLSSSDLPTKMVLFS